MQSILGKEEGSDLTVPRYRVETPVHTKSSADGKKLAPFCLICYLADSQNPRNIPTNVFSDKNGTLWHCQRPECRFAVWNLDRDYIIGCRECTRLFETDPEIRAKMNEIAGRSPPSKPCTETGPHCLECEETLCPPGVGAGRRS